MRIKDFDLLEIIIIFLYADHFDVHTHKIHDTIILLLLMFSDDRVTRPPEIPFNIIFIFIFIHNFSTEYLQTVLFEITY